MKVVMTLMTFISMQVYICCALTHKYCNIKINSFGISNRTDNKLYRLNIGGIIYVKYKAWKSCGNGR